MKRLERLEKNGSCVVVYMNGKGAIATKFGRTIKGTSVTDLHIKIYGY